MPVLKISNDQYDEDQDMKAQEVLPITEELVFMFYQDGNEFSGDPDEGEAHGCVFFYPSLNICTVIEVTVTDQQSRCDVLEFKRLLCAVLFVVNEQRDYQVSKSREIMHKQEKMCSMYCFPVSWALLKCQK